MPQPAGAAVVAGPMGRRPAATRGVARGPGAVPPLRRAGRAGAARGRLRDAQHASRLDCGASVAGCQDLRRLARRTPADRGAAALVPRLLLPRRLRRGRHAGVGLGRPALLRQPPWLHERRGARGRADLAAGQRLVVGAPGRAAGRGLPRRPDGAARARGTARRAGAGLERGRATRGAVGGRPGRDGDAAVHRRAAGGAAAGRADRGRARHALRAVAGRQPAARRAAAGAAGRAAVLGQRRLWR